MIKTVADLIRELQALCGDRDPATVEVKIETDYFNGYGSNWDELILGTAEGCEYPFTILIR